MQRVISVEKLAESYISELEWLVRENANVPKTISGLINYVLGNLLVEEARRVLPREAIELHEAGWIHIYKLRDGSLLKPYCGGIDARLVIEKGLRTPTIVSKPPRHLDSAVDQLMNAAYIFSQERTGAIGLYGVDLVIAPYIYREKLTYREVKQNIQRFIFNLNYPLKAGQSPFTNVVLAVSNRQYHNMPDPSEKVFGSGMRLSVSRLGDYIDEAKLVIRAMMEVFAEGDAAGQPFTFPIPTTIVNDVFEKLLREDPELWSAYWGAIARSGQMYFLNGFRHQAEDIFSFCCRLLSDMARVREILHRAKGMWDMPPSVGSVNVVVINCPRLAMIARSSDEAKAFDELDRLLEVARRTLMWFRRRYERLFKAGMYPMSREYIDPENPFKYYYNTVGVIGLAEYAAIMEGDPLLWFRIEPSDLPRIEKLYRDLLNHIQERLREFEDEDGVLYNLEEVPGESLSVRLAWSDWEFARELSTSEDLRIYIPVREEGGRKVPFYTNQLTPPYTTLHLRHQLELEAACQKLFTGGVIKHVFIDRELEPEVIAKFVLGTLKSMDVVYMSVTPTIAVCPACGYRAVGRFDKCPRCGTPMDIWSRVVGYYRPVRSWNEGRRAEFSVRRDLSRDILDIVGH